MRLLKYLREKWVDSFKDPLAKGIAEVFMNPSRSEYRDALEASKESMLFPASARALYDYRKDNLYVWRGDVLHGNVINKAKLPRDSLRLVIDPPKKLVHIYSLFKSDEEEFEIVKKAMMKVFKFAPEAKGYKVARQ